MKPIILYGTPGCHLCEQAEQILDGCLGRMPGYFELIHIDIADNDALFERYGVQIPVVQQPETGEELGWPFDSEDVRAFLG